MSGSTSNARCPKKHYYFEGFESSPACPSGKSSIKMKTSVKQWWNNADVDKHKFSQCHFVHHKSHMHWPGIKTGRLPEPWRAIANYLSHGVPLQTA
jgi:hypothetical protein